MKFRFRHQHCSVAADDEPWRDEHQGRSGSCSLIYNTSDRTLPCVKTSSSHVWPLLPTRPAPSANSRQSNRSISMRRTTPYHLRLFFQPTFRLLSRPSPPIATSEFSVFEPCLCLNHLVLLIPIYDAALAPLQGRESSEIHYPKSSPKSPREFPSIWYFFKHHSSNVNPSNVIPYGGHYGAQNGYQPGPQYGSHYSGHYLEPDDPHSLERPSTYDPFNSDPVPNSIDAGRYHPITCLQENNS
jgi:hypothetical protein